MIRFIVLILLNFSVSACEKKDPHPELRDPIYKDLKGLVDGHQKALAEDKKTLGQFQLDVKKTEANSIERKDFRIKISKTQDSIKNHEQWVHYYRIRMDRRAVVDKVAAREAKLADQPWPDPDEYSDYLVNKRLREVNLNWNTRVPKLQDRLSKKTMKEEKEPEGEPTEERKPATSH